MGLLNFAGRIVIVIINIIFILVSLALIYYGVLFRVYAKDIPDKIQTALMDNGKLATAMIVVGIVLLAFSFVGCCGACCNCTKIMFFYSIILIVLLVIQVILVILVFGASTVITKRLKADVLYGIEKYNGLNGTTLISLVWNWSMQQFECCGANYYQDFSAASWKINIEEHCIAPIACCKELPNTYANISACAGSTEDSRYNTIDKIQDLSNCNTGCVDKIWSNIMENKKWFGIVIGFCFASQLVLILFACIVLRTGIAVELI